jgi:hypothetical protein
MIENNNYPGYKFKSNAPITILKIMGIVLIIDIISILIGFDVFIIVQGIMIGLRRLAFYWPTTYKVLFEGKNNNNNKVISVGNIWTTILSIIQLIVSMLFIIIGLYLIIRNGFCSQNLFCRN